MSINKKKTAAAPSTAKDTADAILSAMSETKNTGAATSSTTVTGIEEAYAKGGAASAKLKK